MWTPLLKVFGRQEYGDWVDDVRIGLDNLLLRCVTVIFAFLCFHYIYRTCVESRGLNANEYWVLGKIGTE